MVAWAIPEISVATAIERIILWTNGLSPLELFTSVKGDAPARSREAVQRGRANFARASAAVAQNPLQINLD